MRNELTGRIALVTGASRGIGRAVAVALSEAGTNVGVNYLSHEAEAMEVCSQLEAVERRAVTVKADVSRPSQVSEMVETVQTQLGEISILVSQT